MKIFTKISFIFTLIIVSFSSQAEKNNAYHLNGRTMGTIYNIKYITSNEKLAKQDEMQANINKVLDDVNQKMSIFRKDSELSKFNTLKETNTFIPISDDLAKIILLAKEVNQETEGKFDITVGPLVNLWGFGPNKKKSTVPTQEEIEKIKPSIGFDKLLLKKTDNGYAIAKKHPDLYLDLGAIAKGFGVDKVAEYLESLGIENYLVEIGGDLRCKGKNLKEQVWTIGIEKPAELVMPKDNEIINAIVLNNLSITTSGNYRNFIKGKDKKVYSHEIDPMTGKSVDNNILSVSVVDPIATRSDGYSTGIFVLGEKKGMALAEKLGLPIYIIVASDDGQSMRMEMSSHFKKFLLDKQPSNN